MWKDFLFFSKSQRRGIILLIILIVLTVILNFTLALFFPATENDNAAFFEEIDAFKRNLISRDSLKRIEQERLRAERDAQYKHFDQKKPEQNYSLFSFNPNTADSATFVKLGIYPNVAGNIIKYRAKGGKFKSSDDFRKIYGISEAKFNELKPYISIREEKQEVAENTENTISQGDLIVEEFFVELNSADTIALMKIKGIGAYYAREIVKYRNELGGFVSVEQLLEVKNMRPENFEKIAPFCTVDETNVKKININTASVDYMRRHPYLSFYQAKAIYELRRAVGKLNNINELAKLSEFSDEDCRKLHAYLLFE